MFLVPNGQETVRGPGAGSRDSGCCILSRLDSGCSMLDSGSWIPASWFWGSDAGLGSRDWTLLRSPRDDRNFFWWCPLVPDMRHGTWNIDATRHDTPRHGRRRSPG